MGETKGTALESAGGESAPGYQGLGRRSFAAPLDELTRLVDFFAVGRVMIAGTERLGDWAANPVVVRRARSGAERPIGERRQVSGG